MGKSQFLILDIAAAVKTKPTIYFTSICHLVKCLEMKQNWAKKLKKQIKAALVTSSQMNIS